jgi:hypothetical protein
VLVMPIKEEPPIPILDKIKKTKPTEFSKGA